MTDGPGSASDHVSARDSRRAGEETPGSPLYMRLPAPVVAIGLVVLLGCLLALGIYANQNLRSQGIVTPTPLAAATLAPPVVPAPPTPTVAPSASATPEPTAQIVVPVATASPTPVPPTPSLAPPEQTPTLTPLPTVEPTLAAEVGQAYEHYWRVRSQALLELDPTNLPDVMDGEYLQMFESRLEALAEQGKAIKTQISLNYKVVLANTQSATVLDRIEDDSYYVKAGSSEPLSDPANDVLSLEVKLIKRDGLWKVVESVSAD